MYQYPNMHTKICTSTKIRIQKYVPVPKYAYQNMYEYQNTHNKICTSTQIRIPKYVPVPKYTYQNMYQYQNMHNKIPVPIWFDCNTNFSLQPNPPFLPHLFLEVIVIPVHQIQWQYQVCQSLQKKLNLHLK